MDYDILIVSMKDKKPGITVLEHPDSSILIQIKELKRGSKGKLGFKRSRSVTVYHATLEEVYDRILTAYFRSTISPFFCL